MDLLYRTKFVQTLTNRGLSTGDDKDGYINIHSH